MIFAMAKASDFKFGVYVEFAMARHKNTTKEKK